MPSPSPTIPNPPHPHHRVSIDATVGVLHLNLAFDLTAPWTILFGPSGSGKSTILRALCGLLPHRAGKVSFQRFTNNEWVELAARAPNHRALAYAPQEAAVFPHLSVESNLKFPIQVCRERPGEATLPDDAATLFRLHALYGRSPGDLSGGERRRVSLARALATPHACLLLLDEPFTGLDRTLRNELLPSLQDTLAARNLPCLSVTHDIDEALLLNADVIRLGTGPDAGRIIAHGPARDVLADERTRLLEALA